MRAVFKKILIFSMLVFCTACSAILPAQGQSNTVTPVATVPATLQAPTKSPSPASKPETLLRKIQIGTTTRSYQLVVPKKYNGTPIPLVLFLHGRGGNGTVFEGTCGMSRKAEESGFILVYPDALGEITAWNAGFNRGRLEWVDDVRFIRELIVSLRQEFIIDPKRIFVGGYSSGGIMSYRLASELSDTIAAIGVMAGTIGAKFPDGKISQIPDPKAPISILHIHGQKDDVVPYDGYDSQIVPSYYFSAPRSVSFWVEKDQCNPTPSRDSAYSGQLLKETYSGCKDGTNVAFYTLPAGDHTWPSSSTPINNQKISASDLMWEFFEAHPRKNAAP